MEFKQKPFDPKESPEGAKFQAQMYKLMALKELKKFNPNINWEKILPQIPKEPKYPKPSKHDGASMLKELNDIIDNLENKVFAKLAKEEELMGTIKSFNSSRGYGWIVSPGVDSDIFVHYSAILTPGRMIPKAGDKVKFELSHGTKGPQAVNVAKF